MTDGSLPADVGASQDPPPPMERTPLWRSPRLQIWLIAAVFYAILAGMCMFVLVIIIRG